MSLLHPETAEDRMAIVPVIGCGAALLVVALILFAVLS
jgi:hypothetical protein